jgi:anti-sigma regulatory factor (Ser/Thr protein kinase)
MPNSISLVLKNEFAELSHLSKWVSALAERFELTPRLAFRIELALTEVVTNVIEYGLDTTESQPIYLTAEIQPEALTVTVADGGRPFDPLQVPEHTTPGSLEEATVRGLGIHLFRKFTDECVYAYRDGRNELTLTFHRVSASEA